ncbi:Cl channel CLC-3 [Xylariales sp. AK1849]|nr:Cl channel CLC-3 [Xylariales sp. AK1849]
MPAGENPTERSPLLNPSAALLRPNHGGNGRPRSSSPRPDSTDVESLLSSHLSKEEHALHGSAVGERLPYNDYTTIDWLHDLVKDSVRFRSLQSKYSPSADVRRFSSESLRGRIVKWWDGAQGWVAAAVIGVLTAVVAFAVDIGVALLADWKEGYCTRNVLMDKSGCCGVELRPEGLTGAFREGEGKGVGEGVCEDWREWGEGSWGRSYVIYVAFAMLFGVIAGNVTMLTKTNLPAADVANGEPDEVADASEGTASKKNLEKGAEGKMMYMAAGSGIPEIKTILSGFVIPHFLDLKVLLVKAIGATFAVATGMCLGKEGPFVHISTCVGYLVAQWFPKYSENERKLREMLSVACSSGLSVAFGAPIGGVLFSYEEISTYFPRRVLWKSFLCSMVAAATLKQLNPTGTGKLVLFETNYGTNYEPVHYLVFILLGITGGLFGGIFCQANFFWSRHFRRYAVIKNHPVLELVLVVLVTAVLQFPNYMIRDTGDVAMTKLLVDCNDPRDDSWICVQEAGEEKGMYYFWLIEGTLIKLILTIITFGCKVPSGIIIPALDAGALFGRLVGQLNFLSDSISPGIFAMVGSAAFLAGVSRMTVSLTVIMFELTGEVNYILPFMIAILTAKWVADAVSLEGVYDLAQHVLGHPFLDPEHALHLVKERGGTVEDLVPPRSTMEQITLFTGPAYKVQKEMLEAKLKQLKARGLMDAGLVLVNEKGLCHGYLPEAELEFALSLLKNEGEGEQGGNEADGLVDLLEGTMSAFVDRTPLTICRGAPVEMAVEMFGKMGLRYLIVVEEDTAKVKGVIIKKRLVSFVDGLK